MASTGRTCKIVLLGNGSVGKTSILAAFTERGFERVYKQTIGCDFFEKRVELGSGAQKVPVTLQLWDIGGQSISSANLKNYLVAAHAVFLCYDLTDEASFADLDDWLALARRLWKPPDMMETAREARLRVFLLGNKADLLHLRRVTERMQDDFVRENGLDDSYVVCARNGDNVLKPFYLAAARAVGVTLSAYDLGFLERTVTAVIQRNGADDGDDPDGGRTPFADEIEAEDRAAMERWKAKEAQGGCGCTMS